LEDIINKKPQLDEIRSRYPEYWRSEAAYREAAALWDCELNVYPLNKVGVFVNYETEVFTAGRCEGVIRLAHAPNGLWVMATSHQYAIGGGGYAPPIWADTAYMSRDEAYKAGVEELMDKCKTVREKTADISRLLEILEETQRPQLSLF
jgi:hypothetical protein